MQISDSFPVASQGPLNSFRQRLPQSALYGQREVGAAQATLTADDVRLFLMSFIAFFLAIATFIS